METKFFFFFIIVIIIQFILPYIFGIFLAFWTLIFFAIKQVRNICSFSEFILLGFMEMFLFLWDIFKILFLRYDIDFERGEQTSLKKKDDLK